MRSPKALLLVLVVSISAFGQVCKSNQYDMLDWTAPSAGLMNGHYDVIYPSTGTIYWVKSKAGYPWDVKPFDQKYIYDWGTENIWGNPYTYKNFEKAIPLMPRCVTKPSTPGKLASIRLTPAQTEFDIHSSCTSYVRHNLGYVINELWADAPMKINGFTAPTITLAYRYSCNSTYSTCRYKEDFSFQKGFGLMQWTYWILQGGRYVQANQTTHGQVKLGTVRPVHPCW